MITGFAFRFSAGSLFVFITRGCCEKRKEKALLGFVIQAVQSPASITEQDVADLRDRGWEDRDIVDALGQGVSMIDHSIMMQVFQTLLTRLNPSR